MIESQNLANLLNSISSILKKYENHAALTGENFNIFRLLNVQYDEVRTHSAILSDLLNPKGSHGQGSIFLEKFVTQFDITDFDFKTAKCEKEKSLGAKTLETGGRIDIYIEDAKKNKILIENKIYAPEQENQVLRYTKVENAHVFYLTLEGDEPSNYSKRDLKNTEDFQSISYRDDIIKWLELCKKEAVNHPILRETITQYINLIKILTNQSTVLFMSEEIAKTILKTDDTLAAYFASYKQMEVVLNKILETFKNQLEELKCKLADERKIDITLEFGVKRNKRYSGFNISTENMRKHNITIRFEFESKATRGLLFGFRKIIDIKDNPAEIIKEHIRADFSRIYKNVAQNSVLWLAFQWHSRLNWELDDTYLKIYKDKNEIISDIEIKLISLLDIAKSIDELK